MRHVSLLALTWAAVLLSGGEALAQKWGRPPVPSRGACFYEDANCQGQYFCYPTGADISVVPAGTNDQNLFHSRLWQCRGHGLQGRRLPRLLPEVHLQHEQPGDGRMERPHLVVQG